MNVADTVRYDRVTVRNARYQQWQALVENRTKRQHTRAFLVQGVRPISVAVAGGWPIRTVLSAPQRRLSDWAHGILDRLGDTERFEVADDLLRELGEKADEAPELLLVAELPEDRVDRIPTPPDALLVAFDRPASPGNLGTLVRSADAFGAHGVLVTGHATDPYDPRAVRASTGSLLAVPVVRLDGVGAVRSWAATLRGRGLDLRIVGTDESGEIELETVDLSGPTLLVVGSEARGMSRAWREACDAVAAIPIRGTASSLNAAEAATVALYEAARQRR